MESNKMETELKTFQTEFIDKKQNIIIPLLQRDYVQGGRFDVIEPFLGQLISALKDDATKVSLNYIYGYNNGNGFVPIDGQQRLITLWLLHLYLNPHDFKVKLLFESREVADNFCEQLRIKLDGILEEQKQEKCSLRELIIDSEWFVFGWLSDITVCNMLNTLQLIDENKEMIPDNPHLKNITFDFLDINNKGIDEDVYVKMNGRGRPLSYFENLKSWMDEQVKVKSKFDEDFKNEWQIKMDNDWTELFWKNRNTRQEYPEEIDDEQIRFFYSMLLLYWKKNEKEFLVDLKKEEKNNIKSQYVSFLNEWGKDEKNKLSDKSPIEDVQKKTFSLLLNGEKMIPIYWIEETSLFNNEVFKFIKSGLETLEEIKEYINNISDSVISILDFKTDQTVLYQIALKDASYVKTLPLLYALIKTPKEYRNDALYKWMRLWRNLVLNSNITAENIKNACETIDKVSNKMDANNLYQVVTKLQWEKGFAFSEEQINEEIAKAKQIILNEKDHNRGFPENDILYAERHPLLKGCISALFENDNCENVSFGQSLQERTDLLEDLWQQNEDNNYNLVKVLISLYDKEKPNENFPLIRTNENWKILVTNKLKDCFRRNKNNSINECAGWKEMLSCSELIENSRDKDKNSNKSLGIYGDKVVLWGTKGCVWNAYGNVILDDLHNNSWLAYLVDNGIIKSEQKIKNCDFFWGWDIWFKYQDKYFTNYIENNTVCLMNENWVGKKLKSLEGDKDDTNNHFYFPVDKEENKDTFLSKLDCLIAQAYPDADKSVCENCQDKACESTLEQ